jgi:hypothetical protein
VEEELFVRTGQQNRAYQRADQRWPGPAELFLRLVRLRSGTTIVVPKSTDTYGMSSGGTWLRLLLYFSNRTATPLTWMSKIVECIWVFIVRPESGEIEG